MVLSTFVIGELLAKVGKSMASGVFQQETRVGGGRVRNGAFLQGSGRGRGVQCGTGDEERTEGASKPRITPCLLGLSSVRHALFDTCPSC